MAYFLASYLLITGPIAVWIVFSREERIEKVMVFLGYLVLSVGLFFLFKEAGPLIGKMTRDFLESSPDTHLPNACQGSLDEVDAGLRHIPASGKDVVSAAVGSKMGLRGWIKSDLVRERGATVRMVSKGRSRANLEFQVKRELRPDVATFTGNPAMEWGGFQAEAIVPKELPMGRYQIQVESRDDFFRDQFIPGCEIEVVSAEEGAVLDAPVLQALAEQKRIEAVGSSPQARRKTSAKKTKPPLKGE
jgi:hypothetical protein